MERTPQGTPVGVDDPYEVVECCDHLTGVPCGVLSIPLLGRPYD